MPKTVRTKADIAAHPWVYEFFTEDDGGFGTDRPSYWAYMHAGFICEDSECGSIHEPTVKDVARCLNNARRMTVEECEAAGHDLDEVRVNWAKYDG